MPFFSQLGSNIGYGGGIDRDFSLILNYIDEFDRHFSRRHRFINCFIPRFDLEEDACFYYLYGDIPGVKVEDINIEAHDNHTLVIYGATHSPSTGPGPRNQEENCPGSEKEDPFVKVHVHDNKHAATPPTQEPNIGHPGEAKVDTSDAITPAPAPYHQFPPPTSHPHHFHHGTSRSTQAENTTNPPQQPGHKILLSERLVGDFHRTFAFPTSVVVETVKASIENGVLSLVVPKKEGKDVEKVRRISIVHGN